MLTFSIIIPVYNKGSFVVDAINSVLMQKNVDFEVIAIDDGSTDDSYDKILAIGDRRLRVIRQDNLGVAVARNTGIAVANNNFICFLDADDIWSPYHLTTMSDLILSDIDAIAWAVNYTEFSSKEDITNDIVDSYQARLKRRRYHQSEFIEAWSRFPFFCTDSIAVRTKTLQNLKPCFAPGESLGEDQDLWFRLVELGYMCFLDIRTTVFYRRNVLDSLTSIQVLQPIPAFLRLFERSSLMQQREKMAVRHLFNMHLLHIAWSNCQFGRRADALTFLFKVNPSFCWLYWFRIFVCTLLPVGMVRKSLSFYRWLRYS